MRVISREVKRPSNIVQVLFLDPTVIFRGFARCIGNFRFKFKFKLINRLHLQTGLHLGQWSFKKAAFIMWQGVFIILLYYKHLQLDG